MPASHVELFEDELRDVREEVKRVVADPERWSDMPNDQLGGRKPRDLIGTEDEYQLRDLIRAIKHGMPT